MHLLVSFRIKDSGSKYFIELLFISGSFRIEVTDSDDATWVWTSGVSQGDAESSEDEDELDGDGDGGK